MHAVASSCARVGSGVRHVDGGGSRHLSCARVTDAPQVLFHAYAAIFAPVRVLRWPADLLFLCGGRRTCFCGAAATLRRVVERQPPHVVLQCSRRQSGSLAEAESPLFSARRPPDVIFGGRCPTC